MMFKQSRFDASFALKCALFFLASAVFSWGLQAKLSLYNAPQSPSVTTIAKLSTEKHSAQTMASLEAHKSLFGAPQILALVTLAASIKAQWSPSFRFYQVEVDSCRPCRRDLQDPDLMRRPPPALA
jgi:hypothetical protein